MRDGGGLGDGKGGVGLVRSFLGGGGKKRREWVGSLWGGDLVFAGLRRGEGWCIFSSVVIIIIYYYCCLFSLDLEHVLLSFGRFGKKAGFVWEIKTAEIWIGGRVGILFLQLYLLWEKWGGGGSEGGRILTERERLGLGDIKMGGGEGEEDGYLGEIGRAHV